MKTRDIKTVLRIAADLGWLVESDLPVIEEQVVEKLIAVYEPAIDATTSHGALGRLDE